MYGMHLENTKKDIKALYKESIEAAATATGLDTNELALSFADDVLKRRDNFASFARPLLEGLQGVEVADTILTDYLDTRDIPKDIMREALSTEAGQLALFIRNVRNSLVKENVQALAALQPYLPALFPMLRVMFPRLVARQAVTVLPMDKPSVTAYFLKLFVAKGNSLIELPSMDQVSMDVHVDTIQLDSNPKTGNLYADAKLTAPSEPEGVSIVARGATVTQVTDTNGNVYNVNYVLSSVDANDKIVGVFDVRDGNGQIIDTIHITINIHTADYVILTEKGNISSVTVEWMESHEDPLTTAEIVIRPEQIRLDAKPQKLRFRWTPEAEQDTQNLFDLDLVAEITAYIGQQMAVDVDRYLINEFDKAAARAGNDNFVFNTTPQPGYAPRTRSEQYRDLILTITEAATTIYNKTFLGVGNTVLINPIDAARLKAALNLYQISGSLNEDGQSYDQSMIVGSIGDEYKLLISPIVPQGTIYVLYKPEDIVKSVFVFAPYVPLTAAPVPAGPWLSLTFMSRFATASVRDAGIAKITIK